MLFLTSPLVHLAVGALARPSDVEPRASCTGSISSLDDVAAAVKCTTVNINGFTVPAGKTFKLDLLSGTTVSMKGDIVFGTKEGPGPLFTVAGTSITFNGNGHTFDGQGAFYWDGKGSNSGTTKPHPLMKIKISGTYSNVVLKNTPAQAYSVSNPGALVMSGLTIDNSAGDAPNARSGGKAAGHNTDGFDCSTTDLTIQNSKIHNQDDCIAINKGARITFKGNTCTGGHGISIGSVESGVTLSDITIKGNTIIDNDQALRIKTKAAATGSTVSNIKFIDNTATGIKKFGVIIDQGYPATLGTAGTGVIINGVTFSGKNNIAVTSSATRVAVNCGKGACTGTWNFSGLTVTGGKDGSLKNAPVTGGNF